ncbi:MAG: O-antigen polymerase [Mycobacteriales bacterium]
MIFGLGRAIYNSSGTWLSPGAFFALAWSAILVASLVFVPGYTLGYEGLLIIAAAAAAFAFGSSVAVPASMPPTFPPRRVLLAREMGGLSSSRIATRLASVAAMLALLAMVGPASIVHGSGQSLGSIFQVQNLLNVASQNTHFRYTVTGYQEPLLAQLAFPLYFAGASLGGAAYALGLTRRLKLYALAPFVPAACTMLLETTRTSLVVPFVVWCGSYLAVTTTRPRADRPRLSVGWVLRSLLALGTVALILGLGYGVRDGFRQNSQLATSTLASDMFGSSSAFTIWTSDEGAGILLPRTYGRRTLSGPVQWIFHKPQATNLPIVVGSGASYAGTTTQRTLFGDATKDYSLEGMLILMALCGAVAGHAYAAARAGRVGGINVLSAIYASILFGPAGAMSTWTTVWLGWLLTALLMAGSARGWSIAVPSAAMGGWTRGASKHGPARPVTTATRPV